MIPLTVPTIDMTAEDTKPCEPREPRINLLRRIHQNHFPVTILDRRGVSAQIVSIEQGT